MSAPRWLAAALVLAVAGCTESSPTPSASPARSTAAPSEAAAPSVYAGLWVDATAETIGETAEWTNKVEVADLNGDGFADLIFPNGGDYDTPGEPVATQVFFSNFPASPQFTDATAQVVGDLVGIARVAKVADLNADAIPDIVLGTTYQTQSQLLLGTGGGNFTNATNQLPQVPLSVGDVDIGDVDADGDLDLVLADWGPRGPVGPVGGRVQLWLNDGSGRFTDATADQMPATEVRFSWELDFVDVDNDWDLDLAVSAKLSTSVLFENDGSGHFADVTEGRLPQFTNNYDFEAMDLDYDGYLDLATINDGSGRLTMELAAFDAPLSRGTLGMTVVDLDHDGRLDVVEAQGENAQAFDERVYIATDAMPPDTVGPVVVTDLLADVDGTVTVHARIHDYMVYRAGSLPTVAVMWDGGGASSAPLAWYGEFLFRATFTVPAGATGLRVCANDRSGNETCVAAR